MRHNTIIYKYLCQYTTILVSMQLYFVRGDMFRLIIQPSSGQLTIERYLIILRPIWDPTLFTHIHSFSILSDDRSKANSKTKEEALHRTIWRHRLHTMYIKLIISKNVCISYQMEFWVSANHARSTEIRFTVIPWGIQWYVYMHVWLKIQYVCKVMPHFLVD